MKRFYLILIAFFAINYANAQWTALNSHTTNNLKSIFFTDAHTGYVVGTEGLIMKTTDSGISWTTQTSNTTDDLNSIFFVDSLIGYAVGANGTILNTLDSGANWNAQLSNTTNYLYAVYFTDKYHGNIVGFSGDFLHTSDSGVTWIKKTGPLGSPPYAMSLRFCNPDTGYAFGCYTSFYTTTDSGNTWTGKIIIDVTNPPPTKHLRDGCFVNSNIGYAVGGNFYNSYSKELILKTTNGGDDWIDLTTYSFDELNSVWFISVDTGYAVGLKGTIIKTTNGGVNWKIQLSGTTNDLFSVFFIARDTGYVVGDIGTILKTTNGGLVWEKEENRTDIVKVYPNPTTSILTIEAIYITKEFTVTICDVNGQILIKKLIKDNKTQIDIGNLTSGVYFLKLTNDKEVEQRKIIKE